MSHRTERIIMTLFTLVSLFILMLGSKYAVSAAAEGLGVCISVIVPSLLPFFVISSMLCAFDFPSALGRRFAPVMKKIFGVSGEGAAAFFIGVTGGYPLGAASIAEIYRKGQIEKEEAERMLAFCNNTGPAFIIGTAGAGIFSSVKTGFELYAAHILAAVIVGILFSRRKTAFAPVRACAPSPKFTEALVASVKASALSVLNICAFVVFFSAVLGIFRGVGALDLAAGELAFHLPLSLRHTRALLTGILELGNGITALRGCASDAVSIAVCAFILGWGGLSVHCQTMAAVSGTDLRLGRHFAGRALHGVISAVIILFFALF